MHEPEQNGPEENEEDMNLMQMYLMNFELTMTNRIDVYMFQGCPANLSPTLEPTKRKVNYLQNYKE